MSIDNRIPNNDGDDFMFDIKSEGLTPEQLAMNDQKIQLMRAIVKITLNAARYEMIVKEIDDILSKLEFTLENCKAQLFRAREFLYNIMKHSIETI